MPMEQRLEENNIKNENNRKKEYLRGYRSSRRRINRIDCLLYTSDAADE